MNVEGELVNNVCVFPIGSLIYYSKRTFVANSVSCMCSDPPCHMYIGKLLVCMCVKAQQEILLKYIAFILLQYI